MSIAQTIKKMAIEAVNASSPLQFIEGEVISNPPNIQLRLKNNPKLEIPAEFITIPEHLKRQKHTVTFSDNDDIKGSATLEFANELKTGDKVMVVAIQGGQSFFIIDRF